jgi:hypothetical protein
MGAERKPAAKFDLREFDGATARGQTLPLQPNLRSKKESWSGRMWSGHLMAAEVDRWATME